MGWERMSVIENCVKRISGKNRRHILILKSELRIRERSIELLDKGELPSTEIDFFEIRFTIEFGELSWNRRYF